MSDVRKAIIATYAEWTAMWVPGRTNQVAAQRLYPPSVVFVGVLFNSF